MIRRCSFRSKRRADSSGRARCRSAISMACTWVHQALLAVAQRYASNLRSAGGADVSSASGRVCRTGARSRDDLRVGRAFRRLRAAGAERILVLPFKHEVARLAADEFVSKIVVGGLEAQGGFRGREFPVRLSARGRSANSGRSRRAIRLHGAFHQAGEVSRARGFELAHSSKPGEGKVSAAGRMLGRCFSLEGAIVSGQGVGAKQTVPTLNLRAIPGQLTPRGVYMTETFETSTGRNWPSITNVGSRPTFGGGELTIETFFLTPFEGKTPEHIQIHFRFYLRAERKFPSADELKAQIMKDVARAKSYWRRVPSLY